MFAYTFVKQLVVAFVFTHTKGAIYGSAYLSNPLQHVHKIWYIARTSQNSLQLDLNPFYF